MSNKAEPTQAHKALARTFYLENAVMNKAKSPAEKARKDLFKQLEAAGIEAFDFETTITEDDVTSYPSLKISEGGKLRLAVEVATPEVESIDVELLRPLVDEATFLTIVSASKKALEEAGRADLVPRVTVKREGKRNVSVKPAGA